jgi:murein DD-endopeptidase MepM/ murein hydrolase activator NlpD
LENGFISAGRTFWAGIAQSIQHHPKRVTAFLAMALLGSGGAAFAVASMGPDSLPPVRQVLEAVEPRAFAVQGQELQPFQFSLYRSDTVRPADTADSLLQRLGVSDPAAAAFLRTDATARQQVFGRPGRTVSVETTDRQELLELTVRWAQDDGTPQFQRLKVRKSASGFVSAIETGTLEASSQLAGGVVQSSLFAATDISRIPDSVATQLTEIFSSDIDFHRALRKGDHFSVVYETLSADGEPLRAGRVLSAEFVNNGKTYQAVWFQEPGQKGAYYTPDGRSMRHAYLASPVEFSRISSGFSMRFHPILQQWKAHLGTDYAAPIGTAVRTVGDGVVEFAGVQNGYGNVVYIRHRNQHTTVYAHLSKISVAQGQTVAQGQNIGAVGATGWATGPHLHFEFRVNGVHQDPMTIAKENDAQPVSVAARPAFAQLAGAMRMQLAVAAPAGRADAQ